MNSRDIWVVIRARDHASDVFRGVATATTEDFERVANRAREQAQGTGNLFRDMVNGWASGMEIRTDPAQSEAWKKEVCRSVYECQNESTHHDECWCYCHEGG